MEGEPAGRRPSYGPFWISHSLLQVRIKEPADDNIVCVCFSGSFEGTEGVEMKRSLFATLLSGVLQDCLQSGSEHSPVRERQLKTLARASANVVEVCVCGWKIVTEKYLYW